MTLLSEIYDVTLKRSNRGANKQGWVRPTLGEFFMTHRDFTRIEAQTVQEGNLFTEQAKCSANFNNAEAGRAVDGLLVYPTNNWYAIEATVDSNCWWQYDFGEGNSHAIIRYSIQSGIGGGINIYTLHRWKFQGSNNGVDWYTLDDQSGQTYEWDGGQKRTFEIENTESYRYYRYDIGNNSYYAYGSVWTYDPSIGQTEAFAV